MDEVRIWSLLSGQEHTSGINIIGRRNAPMLIHQLAAAAVAGVAKRSAVVSHSDATLVVILRPENPIGN
jgi:hypothetical protein